MGIYRTALSEIPDRKKQLQKAVAEEQSRLTAAQASTTAYLGKLRELHQHEMDYLTSLSELTVSEPAGDPISDAASDISAGKPSSSARHWRMRRQSGKTAFMPS